MARRDLRVSTGDARNVSNQRLNRRVAILVNKSDCCAKRDGKVEWTVDGVKPIMIEIEWLISKSCWKR